MKNLVEQANELREKAENIYNTAKEENRAVTEEEKNKFDSIMNEIHDIENTIEMEEKINNMDTKEIKVENGLSEEEKKIYSSLQEKKDYAAFAKMVRTYSNSDPEPTELSKGANGAVIPTTIAKKIIDKIVEISPLYASATKYNGGTVVVPKEDTSTDDITVDYATEFTDLISRSNKLGSTTLGGYLIGALTKVSKSLLKNSDFDLVNYVINRMAKKFAKFIEKEGLYGTENKIAGIKGTYDATNMKVTSAANNGIDSDELIDLQEKVPDAYQPDAYWIMARSTRTKIRKLKDGEGNYLLNRVFNEKWNYELLGKPVYCSENVTPLGTSGKEVIFYGDFSGLAINEPEKVEMQVLYELFAAQHAIGVVGYAELDAKVENTQKIAVMVTGSGTI